MIAYSKPLVSLIFNRHSRKFNSFEALPITVHPNYKRIFSEEIATRNLARAVQVWTDEYRGIFELYNPKLAEVEVTHNYNYNYNFYQFREPLLARKWVKNFLIKVQITLVQIH